MKELEPRDASKHTGTGTTYDTADRTARLLAKLLRKLLADESFECLADLTDALKYRCARLSGITPTADALNEAYRLIESNRPLLVDRRRGRVGQPVMEESASPITRAQATLLVQRIRARVQGRS